MRKGVITSDLTGEVIPDGEEVMSVVVTVAGSYSNDYYLLDVTADEVAELKTRGRPVSKRPSAGSTKRSDVRTTTTQSFSLPPALLDDLRRLCQKRGTSLSEEVRVALRRHTRNRA